jgi:hypothetical protein
MRLRTSILLTAALLLVSGVVFAQQALDNNTVNRWADSMEEIQEWGETQSDFDDPSDPMDFEGAFAEVAQRHAEVRRIIARHGFSDGDEWAAIGARVLNAYGAMRMEEESPGYRQEMETQLREIENSPHLTPEQKQMMRQQMEQAMQLIEGMSDAPPADVAAVRGNRARLDRLFDEE